MSYTKSKTNKSKQIWESQAKNCWTKAVLTIAKNKIIQPI